MATIGDRIYLDGTNTDKDPYSCNVTSVTSIHWGISINKSLFFEGYGPMPQIRYLNGSGLIFGGTDNDMMMTLSGLFFYDAVVTFRDSSAQIDGCKFGGRKQRVEFTVENKTSTTIRIRNSLFWKNTSGFSVNINSRRSRNQIELLVPEVQNTTFIDNFVPPENDDGRLIKVEILQQPTRSFKCELTLDNVTFSNNLVTRLGMIYVNLKNGHLNMSLNNIATSENNHICSFGDCTELTVGGNIVAALLIELISQRSVEEPSV